MKNYFFLCVVIIASFFTACTKEQSLLTPSVNVTNAAETQVELRHGDDDDNDGDDDNDDNDNDNGRRDDKDNKNGKRGDNDYDNDGISNNVDDDDDNDGIKDADDTDDDNDGSRDDADNDDDNDGYNDNEDNDRYNNNNTTTTLIELPQAVKNYLAANYAGYTIVKVESETKRGVQTYEVKLTNGLSKIEVKITAAGTLLKVERKRN
jgi:hypothetical protein